MNMKKRFMPTLIAFVVLAILMVYANYYETEEILPPGVQKPLPILGCSDKDITAITWKTDPAGDLRVEFNASGSRIVAPAEYRSDKNETDGLLRHFAELKSELIIAENATDTSGYALTASAPTVVIETASQSIQLVLGSKTEVGGSYYLMKKGDPRVFMVPGYIRGAFDKKLADLRDRQFFVDDFGQVTSISYQSAQGDIELRLSDSLTDWRIESPASFPADGVAVAELIQRMRNIRVSRFVEDNPTDAPGYGFASPSLKITATSKDGRVFVLEAGEMSGTDTYVRTAGSQAIHAAATVSVNELRLTVNDLREKHLAVPAIDDLKELTVTDASGSVTIEKKDGSWLVGVQKIAETDLKDFINGLGRSRVNSFGKLEKLEEYGLQSKEKCRQIELVTEKDRTVFWLGKRQGANLSMMTSQELIDISAEVDDAFGEFMNRLRQPPEATKSVVTETAPASGAENLSEPVMEELNTGEEKP